jgi:arabinofuranosyltransferase
MNRKILLIILIACLSTATWLSYTFHNSPSVGIDDANIYFTYAENLASGNGITYANNSERTEGATSMLWLLICSFVFWIGQTESAVLVLSVGLMIATQWIILNAIYRYAAQKNKKAWPYVCGYLALILCSPSYITWMSITLMDTCLWGLFIAGMTYFVLFPPESTRKRLIASIPFILAPWVRPEGMLVAPVLAALLWLRSYPANLHRATHYCIGIGGAMIVLLASLTVFRLMYFGYPLPNPYYAKVSPFILYNLWGGLVYLIAFITCGYLMKGFSVILLLILIPLFADVFHSLWNRKPLRLRHLHETSALVALFLLFFPVLSGGDHFAMFRFYQPAYPLICLTFILWLFDLRVTHLSYTDKVQSPLIRYANRVVFVLVIAYFLLLHAFKYPYTWPYIQQNASPIYLEFSIAEKEIDNGKTFARLFANNQYYPTIGVLMAGGIARTYPGPIVDLMGLNNNIIAHFKGDRIGAKNHAAFEKDAFFKLKTDLILLSPSGLSMWIMKGLFEDPRFVEKWSYGVLSLKEDPACSIEAFFRNSFLNDIRMKSYFQYHDKMIWSSKSNKWVEVTSAP